MKSFAILRKGGRLGWNDGPGSDLEALPLSRRRLAVFGGVFLGVLLLGLAYTFARPAQYRATALLQITPPTQLGPAPPPVGAASQAPAAVPESPEGPRPLAGEIRVLTSRPLVERARERLLRAGELPGNLSGAPVDDLQRHLGATLLEGGQMVQVWAVGHEPARLPPVVNTLIEVYQEHLAETYRDASADSVGQAREEARKLARDVAAKRAQVQAFQERYNIISPERGEQALLSRAKAMSSALSAANERVVNAEAQLRSLQDSMAAGRSVVRAKDNPTLAGMEQRASLLREELRELERSYTPAYLDMDAQVRAKRARLADLEAQMREERVASRATAVSEAQEELASARGAASQLQQQMAADRREVQDFSMRFNEYKALQEQLSQLEGFQQGAEERAVRLEASQGGRRPTVAVIEWAAVPGEVWAPNYGRDAAISAGVALVLALGAVALMDFMRPRGNPSFPVMQPAWIPIPMPAAAAPPAVLAMPERGRLAAVPALPRELNRAEVAALVEAAGPIARLAVLALLAGLSTEEALGLRWEDIDRTQGVLRVGGAAPRELPLAGAWLAALEEAGQAAGPVLVDAQGRLLEAGELEILLLGTAHDARLAQPGEITSAALRHTYLAYLVRQGVRFADLPAVAGPVPAASLAAYSALAPGGPRLPPERVDWVYRWETA